MKSIRLAALSAAAAGILAAAPVFAQFVDGPSPAPAPAAAPAADAVQTVQGIAQNGRDNQIVVLEGNVIDQVKHDKYVFADLTGRIIVEIPEKVFLGQRVTMQTKVRLEGELDKERAEQDEVEVFRLTVLSDPAPAPAAKGGK